MKMYQLSLSLQKQHYEYPITQKLFVLICGFKAYSVYLSSHVENIIKYFFWFVIEYNILMYVVNIICIYGLILNAIHPTKQGILKKFLWKNFY